MDEMFIALPPEFISKTKVIFPSVIAKICRFGSTPFGRGTDQEGPLSIFGKAG